MADSGSMFKIQVCTKDNEKYVARWRFRGIDHLQIKGRAELVRLLEKKAPKMCWLPFASLQKDLNRFGLNHSGLEFYPYIPYKMNEIKIGLEDFIVLFSDLRESMTNLHHYGWYYIDFRTANLLSALKNSYNSSLNSIRCCDIDSFVSKTYITEDLFDFNPQPPEFKTKNGGFKSICESLENVDLFAYSIWQLGILFFSLVTNGKIPNWTLVLSGEEEKQKEEEDPFAFLYPDLNIISSKKAQNVMSEEEFLRFGHEQKQIKFFQSILSCLDQNVKKRIENF